MQTGRKFTALHIQSPATFLMAHRLSAEMEHTVSVLTVEAPARDMVAWRNGLTELKARD